jgi:hypothetical protein
MNARALNASAPSIVVTTSTVRAHGKLATARRRLATLPDVRCWKDSRRPSRARSSAPHAAKAIAKPKNAERQPRVSATSPPSHCPVIIPNTVAPSSRASTACRPS